MQLLCLTAILTAPAVNTTRHDQHVAEDGFCDWWSLLWTRSRVLCSIDCSRNKCIFGASISSGQLCYKLPSARLVANDSVIPASLVVVVLEAALVVGSWNATLEASVCLQFTSLWVWDIDFSLKGVSGSYSIYGFFVSDWPSFQAIGLSSCRYHDHLSHWYKEKHLAHFIVSQALGEI